MSAETLNAIHDAIAAHLAGTRSDGDRDVLTDWFVAFGSMRHSPDSADGISYGIHHVTSNTSPHGALGIAILGVAGLEASLSPVDD